MPDLDLNALLTAKEAAGYAGVTIAAICKWRDRGHLPVATDAQARDPRQARPPPLPAPGRSQGRERDQAAGGADGAPDHPP